MVAITSTGPMTLGSTWRTMISSGDRPITRAACTYSLFFSTSVEPRTVRAYCTQQRQRRSRRRCTKTAISSWRCTEISAAHDAVDQQRDQDRRKGELHVGDAHDDRVDRAAEIAAEQAERDAEHHRHARTEAKPTIERHARAVHDRRQDVAALVVGAERERPVAVVAETAPAASGRR